jgi:hypothetical protein
LTRRRCHCHGRILTLCNAAATVAEPSLRANRG